MSLANLLMTKGSCPLGPIPKERRAEIMAYCQNPAPTYAQWASIRVTIIDGRTLRTLWQAVRDSGDRKACLNSYVPDSLTVARALRTALKNVI